MVSASPVRWSMKSWGRMATDSTKIEKDQRTSVKVKRWLTRSARTIHGPRRNSTRSVSIAGSCVGLHREEVNREAIFRKKGLRTESDISLDRGYNNYFR